MPVDLELSGTVIKGCDRHLPHKHFHKIHHYSERSTFPVGHIKNNGLDQNIRHNQTIRSVDGFVKFQFLTQEGLTAFQASKKV